MLKIIGAGWDKSLGYLLALNLLLRNFKRYSSTLSIVAHNYAKAEKC